MISVAMAYRQRPELLKRTLESYNYFYKNLTYEISLVDDTPEDDECLQILQQSGIPYQYHTINRSGYKFRNPATVYNFAIDNAIYPIVHITNPENIHLGPILTHCLNYITENNYIVYGCRSLISSPNHIDGLISNPDSLTDWQDGNEGWYQHTRKNNRLLHFASIIYKDLFQRIGGFDSRYKEGIGFDDNDFIQRVISKDISVLAFDDPSVGHQKHDRSYVMEYWDQGYHANEKLYIETWGSEPPNHREGW